jgi:hypothetical protein
MLGGMADFLGIVALVAAMLGPICGLGRVCPHPPRAPCSPSRKIPLVAGVDVDTMFNRPNTGGRFLLWVLLLFARCHSWG